MTLIDCFSVLNFYSFKVTPAMVKPFLEGRLLEDAIKLNKIYIINYKEVLDVTCKNNRKVTEGISEDSYN